jgi:hypothetical protein
MNPLDVCLPKWPCLVVTGKPVTPDQAFEILVKTDSNLPDFQYSCNARGLSLEYSKIFGYDYSADDSKFPWDELEDLKNRLGKVRGVEYLCNSQILSSYIGGPHGWLTWDGIVGCNTYNIGKWPSVEDVLNDWVLISAAFPYLELTSWLFNGESCEEGIFPLVRFEVANGKAEVFAAPADVKVPTIPNVSASITSNAVRFLMLRPEIRECGIHQTAFVDGLKKLYKEIPQFVRNAQPA